MDARFVVGIDLGTTNCALADVDTHAGDQPPVTVHGVAQLVNPGEVAAPTLLPSFLFLPGPQDFAAGATSLPWEEQPGDVVGELARKRGAENPSRLVSSAKSWLSHAGVDRASAILPWQAPEEVARVSPVSASARYLAHLARAWDHVRGSDVGPLAAHDVLVTVPASFDEEARELTLRAAAEAGLPGVRLLEEPQAAFYAWLAAQGEAWRERVTVGDLVLVCDVGGGTTDFSLIAVGEDGGLARASPRRRRRSHPARRRQHGPGARAAAPAEARSGRTSHRLVAAAAAVAPVPEREGTAVRRTMRWARSR